MDYCGYRYIHYNPRTSQYKLWTWDKNTGDRIEIEKQYQPFLYVESNTQKDATSIYNTNLRKLIFKNNFERNKYVSDSGIRRIFYNIPVEQQILIEEFKDNNRDIEFSQYPLKIFTIDIETFSPNEFPEPDVAKDPIILITVHDSLSDEYHTWGLANDYHPKNVNVKYYQCVSETDLLRSFVKFWKKDCPDIVTGWNIAGFDMPYIITRISNVLGEQWAKKLSPIEQIYKRDNVLQQFGKYGSRWYIRGVNCIDYMDAYMTFSRDKRESYSLNHIGEVELGQGKVAYNATNLSDLSLKDWDKFVDYNIQDTAIVVGLEDKLQFLQLARMLAHMGLTNIEGALGTVSIVTGALSLEALHRNMIIPTFPMGQEQNYIGGFVKDPIRGLHEVVLGFDANSLYPNSMITLNISPETKVGKIIHKDDDKVIIRLVNEKTHELTLQQFADFIKAEQITITKAKVLYSQKHKGFVPTLIERIYSERVKNKDQLKERKRALSHCKKGTDKWVEHTTAIDTLDIMQYTLKILMNRLYGTFANKYSPFCDFDAASSITTTGQAVVKQAADIGNSFAKKYGINDRDVNIYSDTDSCYFSFKDILDKQQIKFINDNGEITKEAYSFFDEFEEYLNQEITKWAQINLNTNDSRFVFKRESICDVGIFLEKKRYILNILDDEGVPVNKTKYTGVEVASTAISSKIKPLIQNIVQTIIKTKNYNETQKVYREAFEKFKELSVEDIAWPRGINKLEEYQAKANKFTVAKGTPIHVKAAIYHNNLLDELDIAGKYEKIQSGSKIKFFMVEKNRYNISVIAFNNVLPTEFNLNADYNLMFKKIVFNAVERLYTALNWRVVDLEEEPVNDLLTLLS